MSLLLLFGGGSGLPADPTALVRFHDEGITSASGSGETVGQATGSDERTGGSTGSGETIV